MSLGSLYNEIVRVEKTHPCTDGISDKPDATPASVSLSDVCVDVLVEPAHRRSQLVLELECWKLGDERINIFPCRGGSTLAFPLDQDLAYTTGQASPDSTRARCIAGGVYCGRD